METFDLGNGVRMPRLGLGTWPMRGAECERAVASALGLGYRHVDTAEMYGNEEAVGAGLRASGVPREEVHLTTKVWHDHLAPEAMRRACEDSLRRLRVEYVDLYLIHWPAPDMDLPRALETLTELREAGKARAIGVSNFPSALLRAAVRTGAPVSVNQVEYHIGLDQSAVLEAARAHGIVVTAYSPVAKNQLAEDATVRRIAEKHGATPAQVGLAWLLGQEGVAAIPKAASRANQQANLDALRLRLDADDLAAIARLPNDRRLISPDFAPAWDPPRAA